MATVHSFYEEDVKAIIEHFEEENEVPIEGTETDLPDVSPALARNYRYEHGKWNFKGLVNITMMEDEHYSVDEQGKSKVLSSLSANNVVEPVDECIQQSKVLLKPNKTKQRKMTACSTKNQAEKKTPTPQARKARANSIDLSAVMMALESAKIDEAKALLVNYIEKHGSKPPKRTRRHVNIGEAGGEEPGEKKVKRASDYNKFVSAELTRLKVAHPGSTPKERMQWAMVNWHKHKAPNSAIE